MRVEGGCWRSGEQKDGAAYYLHRLDGKTTPKPLPPPPPPGPGAPRADADLLHRAYSGLLARLQLSKAHREALRGRGLSDAEIDRREYRSLPVQGRARLAGELRELHGDALLTVPGFILKPGEGGKPYLTIAGAKGLLVPVRDPAGRVVALLVRRDGKKDEPKGKDDGPRYSYLSSARHGGPGPGTPAHVPLGVAAPCPTCRLTEGPLKADVAQALSGVPTVGAASAGSWRLALDAIAALGAATVRLAFDADALDNPRVARDLTNCAEAAEAAGLAVAVERWDGADGKGIDDLLAAGKTPELLTGEAARAAIGEAVAAATAGEPPPAPDELERLGAVLADGGAAALFADRPLLQALARLAAADPAAFAARRAALKGLVSVRDLDTALKPFQIEQARERPPVLLNAAGYRVSSGCIVRERLTADGPVEVPLCNFSARITEVVTRDDGAEQTSLFTLAGELADGRELPPVPVPTADFNGMGWVTTAWYGAAVVYAGQGTRDHLRAAIELLSPERSRRTVYTQTGWRRIGDAWLYLHAGGAIGVDGPAPGVEVSLPDALAGYVLPVPSEGRALAEAIRASLRVLDVAPDRVTVPLLGAVCRAVLGPCDCALHLAGPTGAGKTELAALAQQHYGAGLDARHLPAGWSSTGNALEGVAFAAANALLTVDDFAPAGAASDVARQHREADRILRAQGNHAGRLRMRADASLRPAKPPRGIILSTGEDVPRGQSLRARLFTLELAPGELDWSRLTGCQKDAAAGMYAAALAGYLRWLAPHYPEIRDGLRAEVAGLRDRAGGLGLHARTPGILADLAVGWCHWLDYALAAGAIDPAERTALERRVWEALEQAGAAQAEHLASAEPCGQFLRLLAGALASGRAHCAAPDGGHPEDPCAWGWRETGDGWEPLGRRIGWIDCTNLYLEPEAAYAEAQELARHQGDGLPVTPRTLWRRMGERGLLASRDEARQRYTVRRSLGGVERRDVLHLCADALSMCAGPSRPSTRAPDPAELRESVDGFVDGRVDGQPRDGAGPSTPTVHSGRSARTGGRSGRPETGEGGAAELNHTVGWGDWR
jgi:hypothetical protein